MSDQRHDKQWREEAAALPMDRLVAWYGSARGLNHIEMSSVLYEVIKERLAAPSHVRLNMLVDRETMREKIAADPDIESSTSVEACEKCGISEINYLHRGCGCPFAVSARATPDFAEWLNTYKPGVVFDNGDMAACWYASQRATTAEIVDAALKEAVLRTRHLRREEEAGQDRGIKGLCDQQITGVTTDGGDA